MPFFYYVFSHHFCIAYIFYYNIIIIIIIKFRWMYTTKNYNDMDNISNGRMQKIGHFRELSNYKEVLIRALEVHSP